ncbi:hypothetical protein [Polaribacter sp. HL-MS24]|uniref:hypothetical protein n=1 Tax=Polaribacter sp. HL-MS24 TaxID=3077735 RepID=UPI0029347635|nr:hypothetical protein [Polaribacter sp. HL-MS24]WOC39723.1 hypothetical protein RRF69_08675 [Polaribacter sp. HL-MS24]
MKKLINILIVVILVSCVYDPQKKMKKLKVINKTNQTYYVYTNCSDSLKKIPALKYFIYGGEEKNTVVVGEKIVKGFKSESNSENGSTYIYDYNIISFFKNCKNNKLNIFLIEEQVLKENTWENIYKKQMYNIKFSLDENYFKEKKYILID